jgi:16S rRNA (cytosine967-C5)-methyltransferase
VPDGLAARRAAFEAVRASGRGRRLDLAFADAARGLSSQDHGFARELAYGTVRLRGRWDHLLEGHVRGGLERLDEDVLDLLRLGVHQLRAMHVPAYAAISETVDLSRAAGAGRAAGLVNGVLRSLQRAGPDRDVWPDPAEDPAGWLSTSGSHPRWLVDRWLDRWSFDEVAKLVELDNRVPELRLVPADGDVDGAAEAFRAAGLEAEVEPIPGTVRVVTSDVPGVLELHPSFVQDAAAALVIRYAAIPVGARVADLCAAPGGKALSAARSARYVLAADPSAPRLELVRESAERLGLPVGVVRALGEQAPVTGMDAVLVDAPCTGTGTLRRHPDARWRLGPDDPARMAEVQARILLGAADAVGPGGLLVYSTCTLEPEENRAVVDRFLAERPEFRPAPPDDAELPMSDGALEVLPQRSGWDGAWAMRLIRDSTNVVDER